MADDEDLDMEKEMAAAMAADAGSADAGSEDAASTAADDMEKEMAAAMAADAGTSAESAVDDIEKEMAAAMAADAAGGGSPASTEAEDMEKEMAAAMAAEKSPVKTDDIEALLDQATESLNQATSDDSAAAGGPSAFGFQDLSPEGKDTQPIELLDEIELDLRIELGKTTMRLEEVLKFRNGSVVALDKLADDPVDVFVNGRLVARAEMLVMNDNFCVRVTELIGA